MAPIDVTPEDQRRAGEALRASFARLAPQGSDEWNFMGAFTLLGDRFGPYQPGASDLADVLRRGAAIGRRAARRRPSRPPARPAGDPPVPRPRSPTSTKPWATSSRRSASCTPG